MVAQALHERFGAVDALVLPAHREIVAHEPAIDAIGCWAGIGHTAAALRSQKYAAAVVTWATAATALVPLLARIPVRVGQARRLYSGLFTQRVVVRSEDGDHRSHWTEILLDYARALGCDLAEPRPAFVTTAGDRASAGALLRARGVDGPYALLHPTRGLSGSHARWPVAGLARLAHALHERDRLPLLVSGTTADAPVAEAIARATGAISVAGATALGTYAALAARAAYVVAMDSGPMHIAAAVGAPTVGIFALQSDEPQRWAPLGARVASVGPSYPCPPSHRKETCPDFACVEQLDVDAILRALDGLFVTAQERS